MPEVECYDPNKHRVILISGMQWGDEGKGKLVSHLSGNFDIVARYNGGHNSGHEVLINGVSYRLHLLPCGAMNRKSLLILGNGTVIHLPSLLKEMKKMKSAGIDIDKRLLISERAHLVFDFHVQSDVISENDDSAYRQELGTTKKGIGPTYASKCFRTGLMVGEMFNWANFERLVLNLAHKTCSYMTSEEIDNFVKTQLDLCRPLFDQVKHCIMDTSFVIRKCIRDGGTVFFEGANGVLLDLSLGTYPFVTSSNTTTSGVYNGTGIGPNIKILKVGVLKCYQTRVGEGPFPTELFGDEFLKLRDVGFEYGTTTGRSRRCGWLDLVAAKYVQELNGFDLINLTKLDVLSHFKEIKVCIKYKSKIDGTYLEDGRFPCCAYQFEEYEPVYKVFEGWLQEISGAKSFEELPLLCREYILFIQEQLGVHIQWVGIGKDVNDMVIRP